MPRHLRPALAGLIAAGAGVGVAELLASVTRPAAGPLVAVGAAVIDATPTPVKEFAVRNFGTYDKPLLLGGIGLALAAFAAVVGVLGHRRRWYAVAGAALFGAVGVAAALSRPAARTTDALPSLAGAVVAGATLLLLGSALHRSRARAAAATARGPAAGSAASGQTAGTADRGPAAGSGVAAPDPVGRAAWAADPAWATGPPVPAARPPRLLDRRGFVGTAALVVAGTAVAGGGAAALRRARGGAAARSRQAVVLPAPADPAAPLPPGLGADFYTRNADFYRVDTALTVPDIDVDSWRLKVHGMVDRPAEFTFAELLDRPLVERDITLNCVSNEVGGPYVGTARWLGVPLAPLLREAGIRPGADQVVARSVEGMTIGTPVETVLDGRDTLLCVGMNGEPLPLEHGFPVRMLTPGLYGYAGACKWITEIELATFADFDAYWVRRKWAPRAPVKTASRIDRPAAFSPVAAGTVRVAGVAWAQGRGIKAVELQVDGGAWRPVTLLPVPSNVTWVQWRYDWAATPGPHTLRVRATDGTGAVQPERRVTPFPDGATGWHTLTTTVT